MAFDLAAIRDGAKAVLATVVAPPGTNTDLKLRAYDVFPDSDLMVPAAVVQVAAIRYQEAFKKGLVQARLRITLLTSAASGRVGQDHLDALLSGGTGMTCSVVDAFEAYPGLPTNVQSAEATATADSCAVDTENEMQYGQTEINGHHYWMADIDFKVLRARS